MTCIKLLFADILSQPWEKPSKQALPDKVQDPSHSCGSFGSVQSGEESEEGLSSDRAAGGLIHKQQRWAEAGNT